MKNCKGFSFAETIAAFSIWSLIVIILVPQLVLLTQERINTQQSLVAYKLLHEKTQQVVYNSVPIMDEVLIKENVEYRLTWGEENDYKKACLQWTNSNQRSKSICFLLS